MKKILFLSVILCGLGILVSGCARQISSSVYDAKTLGAANETFECVVVKVRKVMVEEGERLEDNKTGAVVGAVAGGALGNAIGGGRGRVISTAGGALLGGIGGAFAEKALKSQEGLEYLVRLNSGAMRTVVQSAENPLYPGQAGYLIIDNRGRSRVIPK
ncbi:MAG: glycine zipper 2TM domain-containing protein [Holosporaceae bacterium]|jgi:outer membrane lipoprotein SlyB|nr:glycine zipper 2TM domain-containing protein [Holosporaceae bacterium]